MTNREIALVGDEEARKVADVLHISHISGAVPTIEELRRALTFMKDMGLTLTETSFLTFNNSRTGKVEITVAPKAQTVFGKALPSLRANGILEVVGGLLLEDSEGHLVQEEGEYAGKSLVVGAWAGMRMAKDPTIIIGVHRYAKTELTASTIGDATRKFPNHMLVLRARLWRTRELEPGAIGNLYSREEFESGEWVEGTAVESSASSNNQLSNAQTTEVQTPNLEELEKLASYVVPTRDGTKATLVDFTTTAKGWSQLLSRTKTKTDLGNACRKFILSFLHQNGLTQIMALEGGEEVLVTYAGENNDEIGRLVVELLKKITTSELITVLGLEVEANDLLGPEGYRRVQQLMQGYYSHPNEMNNSFKKHGITSSAKWRQVRELEYYKIIQGSEVDSNWAADEGEFQVLLALAGISEVPANKVETIGRIYHAYQNMTQFEPTVFRTVAVNILTGAYE